MVLEKLIVAKLLITFACSMKINCPIHVFAPLTPMLSQINPVHTLARYIFVGYLTSASGLFPSDYPTKISYAFLNFRMLCLLVPFVLFTFDWIDLLFGQDCLYFSPSCSHLSGLSSDFVAVSCSQTHHLIFKDYSQNCWDISSLVKIC